MFTLPRKLTTNGVAGCSRTSSGVPSCSISPSFITTTRFGELERLLLVVRDEDAGQVDLVVQAAQPAAQFLPDLRVERAERLVEQQHARFHRERARQRHALPLSAGELRGIAVAEVIELHEARADRSRAAGSPRRRAARARAHAQAERDVLEHRHVAEERVVLEDEADAAILRAPPRRIVAVEQDACRRRAPRARR